MAQVSKKLRRLRRKKRELTLAYRAIDVLVKERNIFREIAVNSQTELGKLKAQPLCVDPDHGPEAPLESPQTEHIGYLDAKPEGEWR